MKPTPQTQRKYRLKKAITNVIKNHYNESYFLTFSFNEETLNTTTKEERKKIITAFLNNQCDYYILNCDYGKTTNREHYHALSIVKDKFINWSIYNTKYGHLHIKPINFTNNQSEESKINYLLNHALKETTDNKIIYSRSKRANHKDKDKEINYSYRNSKAQRKFLEEEQKEFEEFRKEQEREEKEKLNKFINQCLFHQR